MRQHVAISILGTPTSSSASTIVTPIAIKIAIAGADEDVGVPRIGCKMFFHDKPHTEE